MSEAKALRCIEDAQTSPRWQGGVEIPRWYLKRWHFLPEGYLSRRSVMLYDAAIRRIYHSPGADFGRAAILEAIDGGGEPRAILEAGCGPGRLLAMLGAAFPGADLSGVDLSPFMVERAADRLSAFGMQARLTHGDASVALPGERGGFDAVVMEHVAGHMPEEAATRMFTLARDAVRPGGLAIAVEHRWHALPRVAGLQLVGRRTMGAGPVRFSAVSVWQRSV